MFVTSLILLFVFLTVLAVLVSAAVLGLIHLSRKGVLRPALGVCLAIGLAMAASHPLSAINFQPASNGEEALTEKREDEKEGNVVNQPYPWDIIVEGTWKPSVDEAVEDALRTARAKLIARFQAQRKPLLWEPPLDYLRKNLVRGVPDDASFKKAQGTTEDIRIGGSRALVQEKDFGREVGNLRRVLLRIYVQDDQGAELQNLAFKHRAEQRKIVAESRVRDLARYFACLVAGLATIAVYSHLQQSTKGRYTWLLRLAALGFVVGMVAVLLGIR